MMKEKFRVIAFIRDLLVISDKVLENYPKSELELKNRIRNNTYDLLELAYEANSVIDVEYKKSLIYRILAKIKVIDFLFNFSYDKKLINEKKYYNIGRKINEIAKFANGWLNSLGVKVSEN